jgi:hypothetical protein
MGRLNKLVIKTSQVRTTPLFTDHGLGSKISPFVYGYRDLDNTGSNMEGTHIDLSV